MTKYFNIVIVNMINLVNTFERKSNEAFERKNSIFINPLHAIAKVYRTGAKFPPLKRKFGTRDIFNGLSKVTL